MEGNGWWGALTSLSKKWLKKAGISVRTYCTYKGSKAWHLEKWLPLLCWAWEVQEAAGWQATHAEKESKTPVYAFQATLNYGPNTAGGK